MPISGEGTPGPNLLATIMVRLQQAEIRIEILAIEIDHHYEAFIRASGEVYPIMRMKYEAARCFIKAREYQLNLLLARQAGNLQAIEAISANIVDLRKQAEKDDFNDEISKGMSEAGQIFGNQGQELTESQKIMQTIEVDDFVAKDDLIASGEVKSDDLVEFFKNEAKKTSDIITNGMMGKKGDSEK